MSRPFFLKKHGIEFAAGLAWHPDGRRLIISYGVGDGEAWVATIDCEDIHPLLDFAERPSGLLTLVPFLRAVNSPVDRREQSRSFDARIAMAQATPPDPDSPRSWFDWAETERAAGRFAVAAKAYARRAQMGGAPDEVWYARLQEARCFRDLGDGGEFVSRMLELFNQPPQRAEPLYDLAHFYRERSMYDASALFCEAGLALPRPEQPSRFGDDLVFTAGLREEYSIAAYYTGDRVRKDRGHSACNWLALDRGIPPGSRNLARSNLFFYSESASAMMPSFVAGKVGFRRAGWLPCDEPVSRAAGHANHARSAMRELPSDG